MITEYNALTGEVTRREMTAEEIAAMEAMREETENTVQVPEKISKLQLKIQLVMQGFDLSTIENAIAQLPEPQRTIASLSWTEATNFYRNHSMIVAMGNMLGLTPAQVDEIFIKASKL